MIPIQKANGVKSSMSWDIWAAHRQDLKEAERRSRGRSKDTEEPLWAAGSAWGGEGAARYPLGTDLAHPHRDICEPPWGGGRQWEQCSAWSRPHPHSMSLHD